MTGVPMYGVSGDRGMFSSVAMVCHLFRTDRSLSRERWI